MATRVAWLKVKVPLRSEGKTGVCVRVCEFHRTLKTASPGNGCHVGVGKVLKNRKGGLMLSSSCVSGASCTTWLARAIQSVSLRKTWEGEGEELWSAKNNMVVQPPGPHRCRWKKCDIAE